MTLLKPLGIWFRPSANKVCCTKFVFNDMQYFYLLNHTNYDIREEVSLRLRGFLHAGEATSPLEPRRRRHLNRVFSVTNSNRFCSIILNVQHNIASLMLNANQHYLLFLCNFFWDCRFILLQTLSLTK